MILPKTLVSLVLLVAMGVAAESQSFSNYEIGEALPSVKLPTLAGKTAPLIRSDKELTVFFFVRPKQENSATVLEEIARCETEFEDRPIYWVGVVSDYYPLEESKKMVARSGVKGPILLDRGDALYGKLGVRLHPTLGIAGEDRVLLAYEPFRRLNYCTVVKARILHALGEIDDAQLEATLHPPKATQGGDVAVAQRNLKFARMMLKAKKPEKALGLAKKAAETAPGHAPAHAMIARILADQGKCEAARAPLARALELDPADETAAAVKASCAGGEVEGGAAAGDAAAEGAPAKDAAKEAPPEESAPAEDAPAKDAPGGEASEGS